MTSKANPLTDARRSRSEELAFGAEQAWATGKQAESRKLFADAAALEEEVAQAVPVTSPRVRSLLAISAVALWYKASEFERAKRVAYVFLSSDGLSDQGRQELERLVERCSREGELQQLTGDTAFAQLEVRLMGGCVGLGVAPAKSARERREAVTSLISRVTDLVAEEAFKVPDQRVQLQVFEAPALAASYTLRFFLARSRGRSRKKQPAPDEVVRRFLAIADAAGSGPDAVRALVENEKYAEAFISGFGEIAPDGDDVERVECSAPSWQLANAPRPVFEPRHRKALAADRTALRWWKPMASADALQNPGNERTYVQLTRSKHPIDHTTWFRERLFRGADWHPSGTGRTEIGEVEFDVTARGVAIGKQTLRLSHLRARAKHHSSPATRLHWNEVMREFLRRNDFTGTFVVLQRDTLGNYQLAFSDVLPTAVT